MPLDKKDCSIGLRVQDNNALVATVRWIGRLEKAQKPPNNDVGTYIGVEYDEATRALNRGDGEWAGTRYFEAPAGTALFMKPKEFHKEMNSRCIQDLRNHFGDKIAHLSDMQLIKFGIARKFDMPKVVLMIEKNLEWVAHFKPSPDVCFPESIAEGYPGGYCDGLDKDGNLLYYERPGNGGKVSPAKWVSNHGIEQITHWHVTSMEIGKKMMADGGYKSKRVTMVIDLSNLGDTGRPMVRFAKALAAIDQDHYPEHLSKLFIINSPGFFATIFKLVRFFLDDRTKAKIHLYDSKSYRHHLLEQIDEDLLPTFAGGTNDSWMSKGGRIGSFDPALLYVPHGSPQAGEGEKEDAEIDKAEQEVKKDKSDVIEHE